MKTMKDIYAGINNRNIRFKLLLYFLTLIMISFLLIGFFINLIFSKEIESAATESTVQAIRQADITVENYIKYTGNLINLISRSAQVSEFLRMDVSNSSQIGENVRPVIRSFLSGFLEYNSEILGIAIVNKNGYFISNEMDRVVSEPLTEEKWYQDSISKPDEIYIMAHPVNRNLEYFKKVSADQIITVVKAIKDPSNDEVIGVVVVDLSIKFLENVFKNIKLGKIGFIYIVDNDGVVVYSPINYIIPRVKDEWFAEKTSAIFNKFILGQQFQFIYSASSYTKWKVVGVFSLNETLEKVINFRYYLISLLLFASIFAVIFAMLFSASIVRPIHALQRLMKRAELGELTVNFDVKYNDEIGQLGNSFNTMLGEIRKLIDMVYKEQRSKRHAELKILQSQIKPHFLYNTFDTIHWMAKKYRADDIIMVITALTNLFRIGLSKGNEVIKLSEEIQHVRNYLLIQKVRYEEMLDYEIHVFGDIGELNVQKLILQPLVENAIYHGIKNNKGSGMVTIVAETKNDELILTVSDDGVGMSAEKLDNLNEELEKDNSDSEKIGYGLFNVNKRIRLSYGEKYGITLKRNATSGISVEIVHPIITNLGG